MSRVGMGASGGAWPVDPGVAIASYFLPQGISADLIATKYGFSRDDVDAYAVESQKRAARAWDEGRFDEIGRAGEGHQRPHHPRRDEHMRPSTDMQSLGQLKASFVQMGEMGGFDAVAIAAHPDVESRQPRPSRRQFVRHRRRRLGGARRLEEGGAQGRA